MKNMNANAFRSNRRVLLALLLCSGFISTRPLAVMADSSEVSLSAVQQKQNVSGVVKDAAGEPIIGASILEKGTTNGIITDFDGKFSLSVNPGAVLQISYMGYKTQEVKVVPGKELNVVMREDTEMLEEVVVVGFGTQKR